LTEKYVSILSKYLLDNSEKQRQERTKRLKFLEDEIEFCFGEFGSIRFVNTPAAMSIVIDSSYQNAAITYQGCLQGGKATLKKINEHWTVIESHRTWIE
jgi:hypothetical protein